MTLLSVFTNEAGRIASSLARELPTPTVENIESETFCLDDMRQDQHVEKAVAKMMEDFKERLQLRPELYPEKSWITTIESFGIRKVKFVVQCSVRQVPQPEAVAA